MLFCGQFPSQDHWFSVDRLPEDPHLSAFFQITTEKARFHKGANEAGKLEKPALLVKFGANRTLGVICAEKQASN